MAIVLAAVVTLAPLWWAGSARAGPPEEGPASQGEVRIAGVMASKISYQGQLTDAAGNPLSGSYNLKFELYDALSGGTKLWEQTKGGVQKA